MVKPIKSIRGVREKHRISSLRNRTTCLTNTDDKVIPKAIRDKINDFDNYLIQYVQAIESEELEKIAQTAKMVAVAGSNLSHTISKFRVEDQKLQSIGKELFELSSILEESVDYTPLAYKPLGQSEADEKLNELHSFQSVKQRFKSLNDDYHRHEERVNKSLNENELRIEKISSITGNLEDNVTKEINKVKVLYEESLAEIDTKKAQIDDILGYISGKVIAGDYEKSAQDERIVADWLRYGALACMGLIILIVSYSLWKTTTSDFSWQNSIFRIVLSFILAVPATYLAKESAKHREQQYAHLQTSLDLKALDPYIASLPVEEQHKIKITTAERLFVAKSSSKESLDSYPINTHEIIMEIIKKWDLNEQNHILSKSLI